MWSILMALIAQIAAVAARGSGMRPCASLACPGLSEHHPSVCDLRASCDGIDASGWLGIVSISVLVTPPESVR